MADFMLFISSDVSNHKRYRREASSESKLFVLYVCQAVALLPLTMFTACLLHDKDVNTKKKLASELKKHIIWTNIAAS